MKKLVWFLLALGLSVSVVGCSKEDNIIMSSQSVEDVRPHINDNITEQSNQNAQINKVMGNGYFRNKDLFKFISSSKNYDTIKNDFGFVLAKNCIPWYIYDYGGYNSDDFDEVALSEIRYLQSEYPETTITELNPTEETITGYQEIKTPNGRKLKYNFQYKFNRNVNEFVYQYYTLENNNDFFDLEGTNNEQIDIEIVEMNNDPNKVDIYELFITNINNKFKDIKIFLSENKNVDLSKYSYALQKYDEWINEPIELLNYIKGNFTNSGYDEYITFFKQGTWSDGRQDFDNYIRYAVCFIVKDNNIVNEYVIPIPSITLDNSEEVLNEFATVFFQGWIGDFNDNGINEIVLRSGLDGEINIVEFIDNEFKCYFLFDFTTYDSRLSYDYEKKIFTCLYGRSRHISDWYIASVKWCKKENCYIRVSNERADE